MKQQGKSIGATQNQLLGVLKDSLGGIPSMYVSPNKNHARYCFHLFLEIHPTDRTSGKNLTVTINETVIEFVSIKSTPYLAMGFGGKVIFDHACHNQPHIKYLSYEWLEVAHGCNIRHPNP